MSVTTTKTRANLSTENQLDVEVSSYIWHVGEPTDCPLMSLCGGKLYTDGTSKPQDVPARIKSEMTKEVDYKVIEKDPLARTVTMNGAVADTTTTSFTVVSSANLTGGEILRNKSTGEVGYAITITSATAIVVQRNLGSTAHNVGASDVWYVIGYAAAEGQAKRSMKAQLAAARTRYCQIFKRSFGVTGTAQKVKLVTEMAAWDEEQIQALVNFKKDIEFSCWYNAGADSSTDASSNTVYLSRGIMAEIASDSEGEINCEGSLDEAKFFGTVAEQIFAYGPRRKAFLVDAKMRSLLNGFARVKLNTVVKETKYGVTINELDTGHGVLEIMSAGVFNEVLADADKGIGVAMDLDRIVRRYIEDRDAKLETDIQTPGTDAREGQYVGETGFSVRSIKHHRTVKNIGA